MKYTTLFCGVLAAALLCPQGARAMQETSPMPPLTAREADVIERKATEAPFSGEYVHTYAAGTYVCRRCGLPLYRSGDKFDSGCGWPAFDDAVPGAVKRLPDADGQRTEILCAHCGAHLGHVFEGEGFTPKNTRHCVNSLSMRFFPAGSDKEKAAWQRLKDTAATAPGLQTAIVAGGCFWGIEHGLRTLPGVVDAVSGYTGGHVPNPSYEQVCTGTTGHAEAVRVVFDPSRISYEQILKRFFELHDPTQYKRQGPDIGEQYRSAVFYADEKQKVVAEALVARLRELGYNVVTELTPAATFYTAEDYHQRFTERTGRGACHAPRKRFDVRADGTPVTR